MVLNLPQHVADLLLDTLAAMLDGGAIELLSDSGAILAVLDLSNPAAGAAVGGELVFNKITEEDALAQGNAATARVLAADGSEIFLCDVGSTESDAVIKLNTTTIHRDHPVRLTSFRLAMG
jgi:hypothetical protein